MTSAIAELATLSWIVKDITWGITLVLMLRSVGAITFGLLVDKYGRKWPFIVNWFVQTYAQFLGVRALFGIAMGGIYGNWAATALEDCPVKARGIISGLLQQGYAFAYLLAVVFNRFLTFTTATGWRSLFCFSISYGKIK
ncbi:major facilitator superfamily domain-containing protein [Lipomyces orientalis]|uniref:Major facilitator superfamily domain-containing protein n=1 Tax=Lipomyces orientalis TaxID=1233043 RepID=A0ACC3THS9_9ASCO